MYSMVLMMAVAGSGDMSSFGKRSNGCGGCTGVVVMSAPVVSHGCNGNSCLGGNSCYGSCTGKHGGFLGGRRNGCNGGGLFSRHKSKGCIGSSSCYGAVVTPAPSCGCCGSVVAPACALPATEVVPVAPATEPKEMPKTSPEKKTSAPVAPGAVILTQTGLIVPVESPVAIR